MVDEVWHFLTKAPKWPREDNDTLAYYDIDISQIMKLHRSELQEI